MIVHPSTGEEVTIKNSLVNGSPPDKDFWDRLDFSRAYVDDGPSPAGNPGPYLKVPFQKRRNDEMCRWWRGTVHRVYRRPDRRNKKWKAWYDSIVEALKP